MFFISADDLKANLDAFLMQMQTFRFRQIGYTTAR